MKGLILGGIASFIVIGLAAAGVIPEWLVTVTFLGPFMGLGVQLGCESVADRVRRREHRWWPHSTSGGVRHPAFERRRRASKTDDEQVARLEAWHRYWHKGCYSGNCEHDDPMRTRKQHRIDVTSYMNSAMTTEEFMVLFERKCVRVDRRTKDNTFPYLADWLSDVDHMLEAGDELLERGPE